MLLFDRIRLHFRARRYLNRHDPGELRFLLDTVKRGDTVLDIGGHKGAYTYWLRRAVGESGRVVVFEPQPVLAARLKGLAGAGSWRNVTVEWMGLSSQVGELTLSVPKGGPSPGATLEARADGEHDRVVVPVSTLDGYCAKHGVSGVRFVKVDVEGHELEVFKGGEAMLRRDRPVLMFECEARHRKDGVRPVFEWLAGLGYAGEFFEGLSLRPIAEFDEAKHQRQGVEPYCNNFVFR